MGSPFSRQEEQVNNNGHAKPSQSLPDEICPACGLPANPDSGHVVVEFKAGWTPQATICRIWHRRCYDEIVDRGEES